MHNNYTTGRLSCKLGVMKDHLVLKAREILKNNIYCTLATVNTDGGPWASPVYYCIDPQHSLYFISKTSSIHVQNMRNINTVSFAIFDSRQKEGMGNGIQGIGIATELRGTEIVEGLKWYRTSFATLSKAFFRKPFGYRLFKLTPSEWYILDPNAEDDRRVKIELKTATTQKG